MNDDTFGVPAGLPDRIGKYEVIEEISRGGMGVVYLGRQPGTKIHVAIKVLLASEAETEDGETLFRREAAAQARLDHPNIVKVHEVGEHEGLPYFAMDFVPGRTLGRQIEDRDVSTRGALEIVERLADALQHAHERGVIHRDMKPGNVLMDREGRPRIMDFGLCKLTDETDDPVVKGGETIGTPAYMPPEQARGRMHEVDALTDVYALGTILYEMLTGRPPFDGSPAKILRHVLKDEPVAPRDVRPEMHSDVEAVCLKAMDKERKRRYATAGEMAADARRFLGGEAVRARSRRGAGRLMILVSALVFAAAAGGLAVYSMGSGRGRAGLQTETVLEKARLYMAQKRYGAAEALYRMVLDELAPDDETAKSGLERAREAAAKARSTP